MGIVKKTGFTLGGAAIFGTIGSLIGGFLGVDGAVDTEALIADFNQLSGNEYAAESLTDLQEALPEALQSLEAQSAMLSDAAFVLDLVDPNYLMSMLPETGIAEYLLQSDIMATLADPNMDETALNIRLLQDAPELLDISQKAAQHIAENPMPELTDAARDMASDAQLEAYETLRAYMTENAQTLASTAGSIGQAIESGANQMMLGGGIGAASGAIAGYAFAGDKPSKWTDQVEASRQHNAALLR